jgi:hypothetical protein
MQFQIDFDHIVAHYRMLSSEVLGGKTLFLALSHLLLGTYFETDGQAADCGAAQVVRYFFGRRSGSRGAGATLRHRAASGLHSYCPSILMTGVPMCNIAYRGLLIYDVN